MHHAVTVERVVRLERGVQGVLGVAQVDAVEVARDLAFDRRQVVGIPFGGLRSPRPRAVGVVVLLRQCGQKLADELGMHLHSFRADETTKLTVVAVLPPKLRVPNVVAPSTW